MPTDGRRNSHDVNNSFFSQFIERA